MSLHAPQLIWLAVVAIILATTAARHGQPYTGKHNVAGMLVVKSLYAALLWWGGFFGVGHFAFHAPQACWLVLSVIHFVDELERHGQDREGKQNVLWTLSGVIQGGALLAWGGFFGAAA